MRGLLLLLLALAVCCAPQMDPYKVLELQRGATEKDVKKAFRRMSGIYHPDKNAGDEKAREKFVEINRAHEILTDKNKKLIFDTRGWQALEEFEKSGGNQGQGGMFDMFGQQHGGMRKGQNFEIELKATLQELYLGTVKKITLQREEICHDCHGTGAHNGEVDTCQHCAGRGVVIQEVRMGPGMIMRQQVHCPHCRGKGKSYKHVCHVCRGHRVVRKAKEFEVFVEKGMKDGERVVFENEANQNPEHLPGDVVFVVKQLGDNYYQRIGDDLLLNLRVNLKEALLGYSKSVNHLDGAKVAVDSDKIAWPDSILRIEEQGMPIHNSPLDRGALLIKQKLSLPKSLTDKQREIIAKFL